ncbi:phosphoprotein associated with glycosphingolipid-enriched microdomains 1 isoform X1 [Conger conger]|uniref:phosphoprotein associated with glycosphingolipid-enriched microdomains 1 isoform X1 n=1 Tax=Conger conger TaxID=82655 RepID=UPI002A59A9AB|nr:phosphoprotein associated with glycosphingolipid-enriched microdomains 1 isoform X1 [Conger conger]XP_061109344.1 phosphoprotein associated with glycosphingolipid-enriched microdomains 1 isoform X1 [Conger conger]
MAPLLSATWGPGVALGSGQLALVGTIGALTSFLLISLLLMLCASCQGQKKKSVPSGDHENLVNGVSEKEAFSQSVDSPATDMVASSSQNGPLTCGTVLSEDTLDTSPHLSEEMLSSQSELRSSKCHQDRELPSIPDNSGLEEAAVTVADPQASAGDGTYEVVKETASRDVSVEDSLYETVKELKDEDGKGLANGTSASSLAEEAPPVPNGRLSPDTPDRPPLQAVVEYASVDLNKKSRYSADLEGRRAAEAPAPPEPEDEQPPPIPDKVLDENDNQPAPLLPGGGLENGEIHSPLSPTPGLENDQLSANELSDMYSSVLKPSAQEKEHDYSSIGEITGLLAESASGDLYATVKDVYPQPDADAPPQPPGGAGELLDPAYETIGIQKEPEGEEGEGEEAQTYREPDYESVEFTREISRL